MTRRYSSEAPLTETIRGAPVRAEPAASPRAAHGSNTSIDAVYALVADDFAAVNALIPRQLTSDVDLVETIGRYIVESGGKRLRPLLVLLAAHACGYTGRDHVKLAAVIEFLHTATLLHDDVVDRSDLRRGRATANALWGNPPSVLVGDFLYSRAFQLMVELNRMDIIAILADATNVIAEGEVHQLDRIGDTTLSEEKYFDVIRAKTAMLFQAAAQTGAILATNDPTQVHALAQYGLHLGLCYQLVDDWLDYAGHTREMGKNVGDDLAEGKVTLPLIHTLACGNEADRDIVRTAIDARSAESLPRVLEAVARSGALEYTQARAASEAHDAIECLNGIPAGRHRDALIHLAEFCVARSR
jgi:octaprenyl-diphosphate synthase